MPERDEHLRQQVALEHEIIRGLEEQRARAVERIDADIATSRAFIEATEKILARPIAENHGSPTLRLVPTSPVPVPERSGYGAIKRAILKSVIENPRGLTKREICDYLEKARIPITAKSYAATTENNVKSLREKGELDFRNGRYFLSAKGKAAAL